MLKLRYIRILSKYGIVYVNNYPPKISPEDQQKLKDGEELLTKPDEYIDVFFPGFKPTLFHRPDAVKILNAQNHIAILHLASSVYERESVHFTVTTIQCRVRQIFAGISNINTTNNNTINTNTNTKTNRKRKKETNTM